MFFDPLVSWIVPAFCYIADKINIATTSPLPPPPKPSHPEPHRDPKSGKIVIENNLLYKHDLEKHGASQTMRWVREGKYNLSPEELKMEHLRLQQEFKKLYKL